METYRFPTTEKWLFRALKVSFSLFLICIFNFLSGNKPSLSSDVENVIEVSPPSSSPSHQATTPTDAVHSLSLAQTTAGTQAAPKPNVTPKQDDLNKDINIENEILVSLYRKRDLEQASESDRKEILTRQTTLKRLKKELKKVIQNATR